MAALMTIESQDTDKIVKYIHECESMGIKILPPDINRSEASFSVTGEGVRFGLSAIKGVGEKAIESIVAERKNVGKFDSLFHLCEVVDTRVVNKQVLEALVKSGSMDEFGRSRTQLHESIPTSLQLGGNLQKQKQSNQMTLFDFDGGEEESSSSSYDHLYAKVEPWPDSQKLKFEKETLGFYWSSHPLKRWSHYMQMLSSHKINDLKAGMAGMMVLGCMINHIKPITIKNGRRNQGRKMAHITIEDETGTCGVVCFPDLFEPNQQLLQPDQIFFIQGKMNAQKDEVELIADEIIPVERAIEKLSVRVVLSLKNKTEEDLLQLKNIFQEHKGSCKTYLEIEVEGTKALLEVGEGNYTQPNASFLQKLENAIGRESITLYRY
mgnify:CR=1 FL=1